MKTLLRNTVVLATCIISGVVFSGATPPTCPFPEPEGESTLFPYKGDCSKYWKCSNGVAYEMQCPAGLHFNDQYKFCDWAEDAGCIGSYWEVNDNGNDGQGIFKCEQEANTYIIERLQSCNGVYVIKKDMETTYYRCNATTEVYGSCLEGQIQTYYVCDMVLNTFGSTSTKNCSLF